MRRAQGEQLLAGIQYITELAKATGDLRDYAIAVLPPRVWRTVYSDDLGDDDPWYEDTRGGRPTGDGTFVVEYFVEAIALFQTEQRALAYLAKFCEAFGRRMRPWSEWYADLLLELAPVVAECAATLAATDIPNIQRYYRLAENELGLGAA